MGTVPKLCPGGTVVCIGGGPSLTPEDVEYCRGKVSAAIAVNDAYKLAPWADVLYAADRQWWRWHNGAPTFTGLKFTVQTSRVWSGVGVLENTGQTGLEMNPSGVRTGMNSGYQAINVAVHLGASRILLLGYDMQCVGGKKHWFGDHPTKIRPPFSAFLPHFRTLVEPLKALGVSVVNCTPHSALKCFPMMPIREALS